MKCCICGEEINGYGNNPWPVGYDVYSEEDRCCDKCNFEHVLPARIAFLKEREKSEKIIKNVCTVD